MGLLCCRQILYGLSHQGSHNSYNVLIGPTVLLRVGGELLSDSVVRNPSAMQETRVQSLDKEDPLQKEMATHSSILV